MIMPKGILLIKFSNKSR